MKLIKKYKLINLKEKPKGDIWQHFNEINKEQFVI